MEPMTTDVLIDASSPSYFKVRGQDMRVGLARHAVGVAEAAKAANAAAATRRRAACHGNRSMPFSN